MRRPDSPAGPHPSEGMTTADNPPILHRKESLLPADYPAYDAFAEMTRLEEEAGLLENAATIGTRNGWQAHLREAGMRIEGHRLLRL